MRTRCFQVVTALPARAAAEALARSLVERRFAACCQVLGPIRSTYWWQGRLEAGREWLCLAKTSSGRLRALVRAIEQAHPYDTPEVIALPVVAGSERYFAWLAAAVGRSKRRNRNCR